LFKQCPRCLEEKEIPKYLKVCFKCAYPKHDRYFWKFAKVGDKVYLSGNTARGTALIPHAYGPHTVHDVVKRTLLSSSNGKTFPEAEDNLLCLKKENING